MRSVAKMPCSQRPEDAKFRQDANVDQDLKMRNADKMPYSRRPEDAKGTKMPCRPRRAEARCHVAQDLKMRNVAKMLC